MSTVCILWKTSLYTIQYIYVNQVKCEDVSEDKKIYDFQIYEYFISLSSVSECRQFNKIK